MKSYSWKAQVAKFLHGGIGTGSISVNASGRFVDWEIFNQPNVGYTPPYTFFAIRTADENEQCKAKLIEGPISGPVEGSHGVYSWDMGGLPRFAESSLSGCVSRANVCFEDDSMPVSVKMESFCPFIPLCPEDSGIPAIHITYSVQNISPRVQHVSVCGSVCNVVGYVGKELFGSNIVKGELVNQIREEKAAKGVFFTAELQNDDLQYGSMALAAVPGKAEINLKREWLNGNWWDGAHDFWDDFLDDGFLAPESFTDAIDSHLTSGSTTTRIGSVNQVAVLQPGEECKFVFILAWHFPNRMSAWNGHVFLAETEAGAKKTRNFYAARYEDAWDVAKDLTLRYDALYQSSAAFENALSSTTLPEEMIDALAANITVLKSNTCFRLENGKFYAWEGCFNHRGCCEGNCTHVWNYAQTLAFLFPTLEQDMRRTEFLFETDENGKMPFRASVALGNRRFDLYPPASDGEMGCIIRLYRDWKLSGNDDLLREVWPRVKKCIRYACTVWDTDGDGVLDAMQHNTYDVEFYGINPLTNGIFLTALLAAAEMARYLQEDDLACEYCTLWRRGSEKLDHLLYNGQYFQQRLNHSERYKYQIGDGCLSDQLFGQTLASLLNLGYILPQQHIHAAVCSIYENNFRKSLEGHFNVQRAYALQQEGGLLMCTWPHGGRPKFPFPYCDEVWTGVEYQVATLMIYEGLQSEAEELIRTVRSRYDGHKRNPWNEVECGHHYARSLASWGLLIAASGYTYNLQEGWISFRPITDDFKCFFSTAKSWGIYESKRMDENTLDEKITILFGSRDLILKKRQ